MQKIILLLACFFIAGSCFPQSQPITDSSRVIPGPPFKATENSTANLKPELSIYPNPAKNKITLQVRNFNRGMVTVKVLDIKGKLLSEDKRLLTNGTEDIIMFIMLPKGIYFIMVNEPGKSARKKLVVF